MPTPFAKFLEPVYNLLHRGYPSEDYPDRLPIYRARRAIAATLSPVKGQKRRLKITRHTFKCVSGDCVGRHRYIDLEIGREYLENPHTDEFKRTDYCPALGQKARTRTSAALLPTG
jgi:hypothetical protein